MSSIVKAALILSAAIMAGCFIIGGIYTTAHAGGGYMIFVVNKFTGDVRFCAAGTCRYQSQAGVSDAANASTNWGKDDPVVTAPQPQSFGQNDPVVTPTTNAPHP